MQTPVKRQVSWDPATVERPPVVKDASWRSLQRAPSTPTTPSKHLLLAFGLDDAANSPTARPAAARLPRRRGRRRGRVRLRRRGAGAVARVAAPRRAAPAARRALCGNPSRPVRPRSTQVAVAVIRAACLTKKQPHRGDRLRGAAHGRAIAKHIVKLVVLVVMGFSPLPFLLTFV